MAVRESSGNPRDGASSTTFWCLRCTLQSRSNKCTMLPYLMHRVKARIHTTQTELVRQNLNLNVARPVQVLLQKYSSIAKGALGFRYSTVCADELEEINARISNLEKLDSSSFISWTTRIPRPPPPWAALIIRGNATCDANSFASATEVIGPNTAVKTASHIKNQHTRTRNNWHLDPLCNLSCWGFVTKHPENICWRPNKC